ncbi:hypothetical protein [Streptomyces sp. NPDC000618]|uniref:hypothetical protein n=1 Tax=Streptomyces sp. NPDC000618 TaxID=3154265 RepID=UPI003328DF2B
MNNDDRTPAEAEPDDIAAHDGDVPQYPAGALGSRLRSVVGWRPVMVAGMAIGVAMSIVPSTDTMSIG